MGPQPKSNVIKWLTALINTVVTIGIKKSDERTKTWKVIFLNFTSVITIPVVVINLWLDRYPAPTLWIGWIVVLSAVIYLNRLRKFDLCQLLFLGYWLFLTYTSVFYYHTFDSIEYFAVSSSLLGMILLDRIWIHVVLFIINTAILHFPYYSHGLDGLQEVDFFFLSRSFLVILIVLFVKKIIYDTEARLEQEKRKAVASAKIIEQQSQRIKENEMLKDHFFANASHELRTPLTLISGRVQQLLSDETSYYSKNAEKILTYLKKDCQQLLDLTDEIRELIAMEAGKLEINYNKIEVKSYLKTMVAFFKTSAEMKGLTLNFNSSLSEALIVNLDKTKIDKVIYNLLSNAIKFTEKGIINVSLNATNTHMSIIVEDSGMGIAPEHVPFIFDRYYQVKNEDSTTQDYKQGLGIGLALANELVKLHGGNIAIKSNVGIGTTFTVSLPFNHDKRTTDIPIEQTKVKSPVADIVLHPKTSISLSTDDQKTLLIVDDHPQIRTHICDVLSSKYNTIPATNGKDALKQLSKHRIDLIVTDIMMPYLDGFGLIEKLSHDERFKAIPVLIVSARHSVDDKLKSLDSGISHYISKPFDHKELILRIELLLKEKTNKPELGLLVTRDTKTMQELEMEALKKLDQFVLDHISSEKISLEALADTLNTSRRNLFRMIKGLADCTPMEYIKRIRFDYVYEVLSKREVRSAREAGMLIGIKNSSDFSKQFFKRYSKHPADMLKDKEEV